MATSPPNPAATGYQPMYPVHKEEDYEAVPDFSEDKQELVLVTQNIPPSPNHPLRVGESKIYSTQPGIADGPGEVLITLPPPLEGVPPGLEYLTQVDTIVVQQIFEACECLTGCETKNKYSLKNLNGEQVYFAQERSNCLARMCLKNARSFKLPIVDNFEREVIIVRRPFTCCCSEVTVESPPGNLIGSVAQTFTCCFMTFDVNDEFGTPIFKIASGCCLELLGCSDKEFTISTLGNEEIGQITKKWGGFCKEAFTDTDTFRVTFPTNLDVRLKALLLGATFLIDFVAFEDNHEG